MYLVIENTERAKELLPVCVKTVGENFLQPPKRRPQGAPFHHLFFVDRGVGRFHCDGKSVELGEGNVIFMKKEYPIHYEGVTEEFCTGWVTFDGDGVARILQYFDAAPFSFGSDDSVRELRRACIRSAERKSPPEVLSGLCYDLLIAYFRSLQEKKQSSGLAAAKNFMAEHYRDDLSVRDVARAVGISESLLYRLFREEGSTPVEHLRALRLSHAKRLLLESPKMPVAEIAAACGFADTAYFCKVFRDAEHMTPKKYRNAYLS